MGALPAYDLVIAALLAASMAVVLVSRTIHRADTRHTVLEPWVPFISASCHCVLKWYYAEL